MTLDDAIEMANKHRHGLTTDFDLWCYNEYSPRAFYLAGRVVIAPNPHASLVFRINAPNAKHRKFIRINRRKGRDWKTSALLRLGFTETEIGTAKLLTRLGVDPA